MLPLIAITMNQQADFGSTIRYQYYQAIAKAQALPLAIPQLNPDLAYQLPNYIDGLLLAGGNDINPIYFDEAGLYPLIDPEPKRDILEMSLIPAAFAAKLPILAICRGMQALNIALGGTIWQDNAYFSPLCLAHKQGLSSDQFSHSIDIRPSLLADIVQSDTLMINSHHHQSLRKVANPLQAIAFAPDGIIEAVSAKDSEHFCLGLQWHPERLNYAATDAIFKAFSAAAQEYRLAKEKKAL